MRGERERREGRGERGEGRGEGRGERGEGRGGWGWEEGGGGSIICLNIYCIVFSSVLHLLHLSSVLGFLSACSPLLRMNFSKL